MFVHLLTFYAAGYRVSKLFLLFDLYCLPTLLFVNVHRRIRINVSGVAKIEFFVLILEKKRSIIVHLIHRSAEAILCTLFVSCF